MKTAGLLVILLLRSVQNVHCVVPELKYLYPPTEGNGIFGAGGGKE